MSTSTNSLRLSDAAVLLLAANLASEPQLLPLRALVAGYPDVLHFTALLEILLKTLPETTAPEDYIPIVYRSYRQESEQVDISRIPTSYIDAVTSLLPLNLERRLSMFGLSNIPKASPRNAQQDELALSQWFFDRARRVEAETGMIDLARQIVLPDTASFKQTPPFPPTAVTIWGKGIVQVLQTFVFDNDDEDDLQLVSFEHLDADSTIRLLLSRTTPETVARNIRSLVSPFIQYVNFHEPGKQVWETVWDWLLDHAAVGELEYLSNWARDGPAIDADTLQAFLRTCLTACYLYHQSSPSTRQNVHWIRDYVQQSLPNIATQTQIEPMSLTHPETDLLPSQLRNSSPLTALNASSVRFLDQMIKSADIVAQYSVTPEISPRELVTIRGSEETQKQLLDRLLRSEQSWTKRNEDQWKKLRQSLKWLQSESRVLGKLSIETVDASILTALLDASAFGLARDIFVRQSQLPTNVLEKTILETFYRFYDNATNCNRTRGGMKNAFQTLHVLDDPSTTATTSAAIKLVSATHALSNYSLSLTPGVPITPAQIRMNKDPALLVCKVIENNPTVYREADRMMKILTDLIDSIDLFQHNPETLILETNRMQARVYAALTTAALSENDFTTAYSTCINKLSPLTSSNPTDQVLVNTTWTAFYQTGIYTGRSSTRIPPSYLDFQKMELLARALLICPKDNIEIILRHWTHLEEKQLHPEITEHKTQSSDHAARGTTSPLISGDSRNGSFDMERETNSSWGGSSSRFGVRDTVKTGLTQGIGWLLGATSPLDSNDEDQRI